MCSISSISLARSGRWARKSKKALSKMQPYLITSAMPSAKVASGRVSRVSGSMSTSLGCQKAPARFLPWSRSMATLPPTEESTWERRVVGICTKSTPRRMVAAAKPARSPTTPPPRATTASVRVRPKSIMHSHSRASSPAHLEASPAGISQMAVSSPAASSGGISRFRYKGPTVESVTTNSLSARGSAFRQYSPARPSRPRSMRMS